MPTFDASIVEQLTPTKNLLAISSHVVHGSVGNDAIQFPLNLRNWNVDCIHTTNLSNHPGYRKFKGTKADAELISILYTGLVDLNLHYDAAIIGYTASKENTEAVYDILRILKDNERKTITVLDPILGDNGKLYVSPDLIPVYKDILKDGLVSLVTPNQFEIETLTDIKIDSVDDLKTSILKFYQLYNVKNVVVTSVQLKDSNDIYCVGSNGDGSVFYFKMTHIDAVFSGSGDLFLGLLTDCFVKYNGDLVESLKETITVVTKVLQLTYDLCTDYDQNGVEEKRYIGNKLYLRDTKLIESKEILIDEHPAESSELVPIFI